MKTHLLTAAILCGLAGGAQTAHAAQAVMLNPLGVGQVLLYPYYTVNGGNDTYLSVVNTTNRAKAVVVRFMESRNSQNVLQFHVYLSPFDTWTGALIALDADGPANLITRDSSCTVPDIRTNATLAQLADGTRLVPFRNFSYTSLHPDNGDRGLSRTREGHLEVIEMGTLNTGSAPTQVAEEVTHVSASGAPNSGVPLNCAQLVGNWQSIGGAWGDANSGNRQLDINLPQGGLYGEATIINVGNGTLHAYAADAIEGFYGGSAAPGGLHYSPGNEHPSLADGSDGDDVLDSSVQLSTGETIVSSWNTGVRPDAISAVLMQDAIYNEFNTEAGLGGQSEWVITFPTKRFYSGLTMVPVAPFTNPFGDDGKACDYVQPSFRDREERALELENDCLACPPGSICGLPPPEGAACSAAYRTCYSAQVESINQPQAPGLNHSAIFGAPDVTNMSLIAHGVAADKGQMKITFDDPRSAGSEHQMISIDGDVYTGLPVIGFWSANYVNSAAQSGRLANYSGAVRHRGTRNIVGS